MSADVEHKTEMWVQIFSHEAHGLRQLSSVSNVPHRAVVKVKWDNLMHSAISSLVEAHVMCNRNNLLHYVL